MKDQTEVCPLSRGMILASQRHPYLSHYRTAFAFSVFLYPHLYRFLLRVTFPDWQRYGFTMFRLRTLMG